MTKEEYNKFELARIIGARSLQLAMGAPPLIRITKETTPLEVAQTEFEKGKIPITVIRD